METIISQIEELHATLTALLPMQEERAQALGQKIRLEFNYNSNHIEGNTLTYGETQLYLIFGKTRGSHDDREYMEMKAHDLAWASVQEWAKDQDRPLTETMIKNLNLIALKEPFFKDAITPDGQKTRRQIKPGEYKEFPNHVLLSNGEKFHYATPIDTPIQMGELVAWYNDEEKKKQYHPLELAAILHYKFVCIHPFDDGNGRVSRLLMNYVLLKHGYPPVIIKSVDKKGYLNALNQADTGNIEAFIRYIGSELLGSLELYIKAAKGESIDDPDDLDKRLALLDKKLATKDQDKEIEYIWGKEAYRLVYHTWLRSLVHEAMIVIQKFNRYFIGTDHAISLPTGSGYHFIDNKPEDILALMDADFESRLSSLQMHNARFTTWTQYGTFKKSGLQPIGCNYHLEVAFNHTGYEVMIDRFIKDSPGRHTETVHVRLLHQPLTVEEIKSIAKELGKTILSHIEYMSQ